MVANANVEKPRVTIVCPVHNEERAIPLFYERFVKAIAEAESKVSFELLFVNNRSEDGTLAAIAALQEEDPRVHVLTFSRNFGYQASITAGMHHARGDAIGNIDVDCEDPPEMIPMFVDRWLSGVDVVYGLRDKRKEFVLMHLARKLFYRGTRRIADHEIILDMAEFFLVDKRVRDAALTTKSSYPFVRGQVGYVGFRREGIPYTRQQRIIGKSHYNVIGAARFGAGGVFSSTTLPLRSLAYVGSFWTLAGVVIAAILLLGGDRLGLAWGARILCAALALQMAWTNYAFGAIGIYLGRVYKDVLGLPLYVVDERLSSYGKPRE